jgi:lysyl endopeptidase
MKKQVLYIAFSLLTFWSIGQQGDGGIPKGFKLSLSSKNVETRYFNQPDIAALRAEDALVDGTGTAPWRFGYNHNVNLSMENSGNWFTLPNGDMIWALRLFCDKAQTINLSFENTRIPEGNELYVYSENRNFVLGKFTDKHVYKGELGTELVPGQATIVEYFIPKANVAHQKGFVQIGIVTHGYRSAGEYAEKAFGGSGSCNMNVNCPDGADWIAQRNSAVMLVSGSNGFCSGALINNTMNDGKPYVLTANHCGTNPTNWVFRFNWQADGCTNPASSPSFESLSGGVLRANRQPSDMCLVEITGGLEGGTIPGSFNAFFAGWNNSNTPPTSTVSIHHPAGDIKKISFDDNPAVAVQEMGSSEPNSSWQVIWDRNTTTEGGSSGSPLFDQNKRIIGQLWGGGASCTNLSAPDFYGRLHNSWEPAGSNSTNQLKYWLDPAGTGVEFIDGISAGVPQNELDGALGSPVGMSGNICGGTINPGFNLVNLGSTTMTSATITYSFNGGAPETINWSSSLGTFQSEFIALPETTFPTGSHSFVANITQVNGLTDDNAANNSISSSFSTVVDGADVELKIQMDCYASEVSWILKNSSGATILTSSPYQDNFFSPQLVTHDWCLAEDCYELTINDSFGDGIAGGGWCTTTGWATISENGATLTSLPQSQANFGSSVTLNFCTAGAGEVSLDELLLEQIKLYPNPTTTHVEVVVPFSGDKRIEILSTTGAVIGVYTMSEFHTQIDLSQLSAGIYTARIATQKGVGIKKIVKQ